MDAHQYQWKLYSIPFETKSHISARVKNSIKHSQTFQTHYIPVYRPLMRIICVYLIFAGKISITKNYKFLSREKEEKRYVNTISKYNL